MNSQKKSLLLEYQTEIKSLKNILNEINNSISIIEKDIKGLLEVETIKKGTYIDEFA